MRAVSHNYTVLVKKLAFFARTESGFGMLPELFQIVVERNMASLGQHFLPDFVIAW